MFGPGACVRMAVSLATALSALITLAIARPAQACSCSAPRLERRTVPADGTDGFPANGTLRVFLGGFPEVARRALPAEYRLVDDHGAAVAVDATVDVSRLELHPRAPLRPDTRYTLERLHAYDAAGVEVGDTVRALGSARSAAPTIRLAWFSDATFRTASSAAPGVRALAPRITDAQLHFAHGGGDCGPGMAVRATFELPGTRAPTDMVLLEIRGTGLAATTFLAMPAPGASDAYVSDMLCNPDPVRVPFQGAIETRIVVRDATGTTLGTSAWVSAHGQPRMPLSGEWHRARTGPPHGIAASLYAWLTGPIVAASAPAPSGPAACANGLEISTRTEIAAHGAPWTYEQISTVAFEGASGWVALDARTTPSTTDVLALDVHGAATMQRRGIVGLPEAGAASAAGPLFVTRVYGEHQNTEATLHALGPDGRTRWSRTLPSNGRDYRLAVGGGLVLAGFRDHAQILAPTVGWALFDAATGAPVGTPSTSAESMHLDGSLGIAWVGDAFLAAWPAGRRGATTAIVRIARDGHTGALSMLPIACSGHLDMTSAGTRAAIVTSNDGQIEAWIVDAGGRVERGPTALTVGVADGDNRSPRVTFAEDLFAVGWESHPSRETFATVFDRGGAVAPAVRLWDARGSSTPLVAATPQHTFVASFSVDNDRLYTAPLRCRASPTPGAPQRIAPGP